MNFTYTKLFKQNYLKVIHINDLSDFAREGDLTWVQYSLENITHSNDDLDEALRMAAGFGSLQIVALLYNKGADPFSWNQMALGMAEYHEHKELVKYLKGLNK